MNKRLELPAWRIALAGALLCGASAWAQTSSDRVEGLRDNTPRWHALTEARLVLAPGRVVERGTIVLRDGVIVAAGAGVPVPAGARVWRLAGRTVYPGFIDLASSVGVPANLRASSKSLGPNSNPGPGPLSGRTLAARNAQVHPEQSVAPLLDLKADELKGARELGFSAVLASPAQGIFRGQSALISTADSPDPKRQLLAAEVAQHLSHEFERGRSAGYPSSLMGAIALVRQTWWDARWYGQAAGSGGSSGERHEFNQSLQALQPALARRQPVIYQADDEQDYQRIARLRDEFKLNVLLLGNGYEYRRAAQLKSLAMPVIVPLAYPEAPEVENPDSALDVSLHQLQHWELAPSNLSQLAKAGVEFAVTPKGLKEAGMEFWPRLRQAVRRGLAPEQALAALTTVPAQLLGQSQRLGRIAPGQIANLVVASGDLFGSDTAEIELSFVDGRAHASEAFERLDVRGEWRLSSGAAPDGKTWPLVITGTPAKPSAKLDGKACEIATRGRQLLLRWPCEGGESQWLTLAPAPSDERLQGQLLAQSFSAERTAPHKETPPKPELLPELAALQRYPAGAYGVLPATPVPLLLVRNATVWTSAAAGRLERNDLLIRDGKIVAIGVNLAAPAGAVVIDAAGKHLTPGLIDAHSHTAIAKGVNEGTSSITAEVRVGDVLDATDINIYRELAGGLTAANLLHGSANTVGGQSQVIKLRWGADAEALKFAGAAPGIKFALGENVKQSNWGDGSTTRYPQTRMGVEQILRDAFQAARQYQAGWDAWRKNPKAAPEPRRDLQLDTLLELLQKKRQIHIHSYRADEILMFTKIAREFGLSVAAFQHVLEGYKVGPEIAALGAGGSTFSDWWAYKMEVLDAVPYNGVLMHKAGVLTSFNSDSDELARRLNTEAAKAVRYGGLEETEALKFVTINPARQLGVAERVGSLEVGKDADFVIWSGHPLATSTRAEQTWIEGRRYFDIADDAALRAQQATERARLLAKALTARQAAGSKPDAGKPPANPPKAAEPPSALREALAEVQLQQWLHEEGRYRESYSNTLRHECTEEQQ